MPSSDMLAEGQSRMRGTMSCMCISHTRLGIKAGMSLEGGTGPGESTWHHGSRAAATRPLEEVPAECTACLGYASGTEGQPWGVARVHMPADSREREKEA